MPSPRPLLAVAVALCVAPYASGQASAIPQLSSRPGAAYTFYLNFGGFNYSGTWYDDSPGITVPYSRNAASTFNAAEINDMREIWSRTAEKFSAYNINVTTVDPAAAAGQAGTDAARKAYYDSQPRLMHNVIGGNGGWYGSPGVVGVSGLSVAATTQSGGLHTNWTFSANYVTGGVPELGPIAETSAHEIGHAMKLMHQSQYIGGVYQQEYDPGDALRAPIMGNSDLAARGLWRRGATTSATTIQNDAGLLLTNAGITGTGTAGFVDSGKGHTRATATALPLTGTSIDFNSAKGVITPNATNPNPLGEANYTQDWYSFTVPAGGTGTINVVLRSGLSTITPGTADPGAMLDGTLRLVDSTGAVIVTADTDATLLESISRTGLTPGTYYLQITSNGADTRYFDMGSYFLTGTLVVPIPEPTGLVAVGLGLAGLAAIRRRRKAAAAA